MRALVGLGVVVMIGAGCGSSSTTDGGGSGRDAGGGSGSDGGPAEYLSDARSGNFWIGPVDYSESQWHNACAPSNKYPAGIQQLYGDYIMGLANEAMLNALTASAGQLCDVCAELTANGHTLVAHVVTYGVETGPNDIDVSPQIDSVLGGSTGRTLTWRFVTCPTSAPIQYTFDGRQWTNTWFFRVWVRNSRVPVTQVEFRVSAADSWQPAELQNDGAWQASNQDFGGGFSLRVTGMDGQSTEDTLPGLNTFDPDVGVASHGNLP